MTIPETQQWLSPAQVADAFGKKVDWVYDSIRSGRSNRAGTTGIPKSLVKRVGGSIHIHRSFVFPEESQPSKVVPFIAPSPSIDEAALARAFVDELISRLIAGNSERRSA